MLSPAPSPDRINGRLVYAIGDVHGRYDLLTDLLERIAADITRCGEGRRPVLIFCGDYIDRGPQSAEVVESLIWLRTDRRFDLHLLKGNHEDALLAFLDTPDTASRWLQVGGRATLSSYGVSPPHDINDPQACLEARDDLARRMPSSHRLLLAELETMVVIGDYAFVHAGVRPGVKLADQSPRDLMWIREGFLERRERFEKRIVHGHSWTSAQPEVMANRINIDTGAFKTGVLTAVRIQDMEVSILQSAN